MTIHAIQTGAVRIKQSQVHGRGRGWRRRARVFGDAQWTDWLPTYAWLIDHPEGIIVVDAGQGTHLLESGRSWHPYLRWEVTFRIDRDQEIGPQLRSLGVRPKDVRRVVLTHLHIDHDGGLAHFPDTEILVSRHELRAARGWMGRVRGYLPNRWPTWFNPVALDLAAEPFGPFAASKRLTMAGDVIAVGTPGHTPGHVSVIAIETGMAYFMAGDASYTETLMLDGQIDGVSGDDGIAQATLEAIKRLAADCPTVYLPTHDPASAERLAKRAFAQVTQHQTAMPKED